MKSILSRVNLANITRKLFFPYPVSTIGRSSNNPQVDSQKGTYPDHIEVCIRLFSKNANLSPSQSINGVDYQHLSFPHVLVKPPRTTYAMANMAAREVFYLIYPSAFKDVFEKMGLFEEPLCWNIRMTGEVEEICQKIYAFSADVLSTGNADRIDLLCIQLIHELLLMKQSTIRHADRDYDLMLKVDSYFRIHAFEPIDLVTTARKFGLSRSSFFRYWKRYSDLSPADYLRHLRLQEATRLLADSTMPVAEISRQLSLGEPAYMGMLFKKQFGMTPLQYRKSHASPSDGTKGNENRG